jgi:serine/threonine protein kinase
MRIAPYTQLGPYEILSLIGEGGMGEVWKARDTRLNRIVAMVPGNLWLIASRSVALGHTGQRDALREVLESLLQRATKEYVPSLILGVVHAAAGNSAEAFRWLDAAVDERQPWTVPFLMSPVVADFVRGPRYDNLFRRMNLPAHDPQN